MLNYIKFSVKKYKYYIAEYLLALKVMRAKGLIPNLSGACWSLSLVGWYSVVSAAYGNSLKSLKHFKKYMGLNNRLINFIQSSPPHN